MTEIWRDVPNFEGLYAVARDGRVRSLDRTVPQRSRWGHEVAKEHRGCVLRPYVCQNGRHRVVLHDADHRRHMRYVDRLVDDVFSEQT
jgi:NUMOD4 motif